jgi:ABC-type nitrate/sulfonate/bicarbonate transport system substrate-binding protein
MNTTSRPRRTPALGLAAVAALVLLAGTLAACGDDGSATGKDGERTLTLVLDWTPNTNHSGIYLADEKGWYRDAGIELKIVQPGENGSLSLLPGGKAQIAIAPQESIVPARAEGLPIVAVAAVIQHNTSSLLSLADDGITRPAELEGKKYGGYGGVLEGALIDKLVECDGGDPGKVDRVDIGNVDFRVGLEKDFYDSVWIYDGWDKIRLAEIDELAVDTIPFVDHTDCIPDWYTPMIATTEQFIAKDRDVLKTFMDVTARGYREAMTDPSGAGDALMAAAPELDADLVQRSADYLSTRYADDPDAWGHQEEEVWTGFVDFLVEAGLIEEAIDVEPAFTNEFLPERG